MIATANIITGYGDFCEHELIYAQHYELRAQMVRHRLCYGTVRHPHILVFGVRPHGQAW